MKHDLFKRVINVNNFCGLHCIVAHEIDLNESIPALLRTF